jgi:hypothetical protein
MDPLDRLIELARYASSRMDRLRIERTIRLVMRARETVLQARRIEQQAWGRLIQARVVSQRLQDDGTGHPAELQIMNQDIFR